MTMYCIVKDETTRESEEEVAVDVLQVLSLHFARQYNKKGCKFIVGIAHIG